MDVSIVIRTKNEARYIGQTLEAISEQDFKGNYEIIIVDSESADGTQNIAKRHGVNLIVIPQKDFSYGRSLNLGARQSRGRFIVNLSAHALPVDNQWLGNLISGFHDSKVAAVYGRQISNGRVNPLEAMQNERFFGPEDTTFDSNSRRCLNNIHFSNSNCAIRKAVWSDFQFHERVPYAEDTLWQREVTQSGFSILYKANAGVYHTHKLTPGLAYKNSRGYAQTLAAIDQESHSLFGILHDLGMFWGLLPLTTVSHLAYIWQRRYWHHLAMVPCAVFSMLAGWLVGRVEYRLNKGPGQGQ